MQLPDAVKATIRAIWPKVKHLHAGSDEQRREGTKAIIEQVVFSHPGQGYGWKSGDSGRPPSKDAMAQQRDGKLYYIDLVNGSTRELVSLDGDLGDITGQHFIPVAGVNHIGSVPVPDPVRPHIYDGGENDTGECDRCGQSRSAAIHVAAPDPLEPQPGDVTLAQLMAEVRKLSARFDRVFR